MFIEPTETWGYQYLDAVKATLHPDLITPCTCDPVCCIMPGPINNTAKNAPIITSTTPESTFAENGSGQNFNFTIAPNPVKDVINIRLNKNLNSLWQSSNNRYSFYLYNLNSNSLIRSWENMTRQSQYDFNIKGIKSGQYIVEMTSGKEKKAKQIIITE